MEIPGSDCAQRATSPERQATTGIPSCRASRTTVGAASAAEVWSRTLAAAMRWRVSWRASLPSIRWLPGVEAKCASSGPEPTTMSGSLARCAAAKANSGRLLGIKRPTRMAVGPW